MMQSLDESQNSSHNLPISTGILRQKDELIKTGSVQVSQQEQNEALRRVDKITGLTAERKGLIDRLLEHFHEPFFTNLPPYKNAPQNGIFWYASNRSGMS